MNIEFYIIDGDVWYLTSDGKNERLDETKKEVVDQMIDTIMERYPEAYNALSEWYRKSALNVPYYRYLIVKRFCKCNFGNLDMSEIDCRELSMRFEKVQCPLRGECKYEGVICGPVLNTSISAKEMQVMKLVYEGKTNDEIAERLFISPYTVKNHIKSVFSKLEIHDRAEFMRYAIRNHMFNA